MRIIFIIMAILFVSSCKVHPNNAENIYYKFSNSKNEIKSINIFCNNYIYGYPIYFYKREEVGFKPDNLLDSAIKNKIPFITIKNKDSIEFLHKLLYDDSTKIVKPDVNLTNAPNEQQIWKRTVSMGFFFVQIIYDDTINYFSLSYPKTLIFNKTHFLEYKDNISLDLLLYLRINKIDCFNTDSIRIEYTSPALESL